MAKGYKGRAFVNRQMPLNKAIELEALELLVESNPDITDEEIDKESPAVRKAMKIQAARMQAKIEVISPFNPEDIVLPELPLEEYDLLTEDNIRRICEIILKSGLNVGQASRCVGIPLQTAIEYMEVGNADLAAGMPTRKAVFAYHVNVATGALQLGLIEIILNKPINWQNVSFILERCHAEDFSDKRVSKKELKNSSQLEALQRQLSGCMGPSEPRRLPSPRKPVVKRLEDDGSAQ